MMTMTFKQMIWQYLPRDLLHCVYSEWLTWSDLSALDIACLSNQEEWLSSVSSLLKTEACSLMKIKHDYIHNERLVSYYKWLGSRKVLVRDKFPMRLSVLEDLLHLCDPVSFCPALHSIVILLESKRIDSCDDSRLESSLSCFLSHCKHLEAISARDLGINDKERARLNNILYTALNKHLQDNQLVKMGIYFHERDNLLLEKMGTLLSKHDKSLKELEVHDWSDDNPGLIHVLENLIKSRHALRALDINLMFKSGNSTILPSLLQYLSSAGLFLETLIVDSSGEEDISLSEDSLLSISRSCPKLERLTWNVEGVESDEIVKPSLFYHLCPNLKYLSLQECMIDVDEDKNRMYLRIPSQPVDLEDSIECLFLALQRRPCTHVGLSIIDEEIELGDSEWSVIKSKLGPVLTSLGGQIPEDILIDFVKDLPRLKILDVLAERYDYSDESLSSIAEYGQNLTELSFYYDANIFEFSEEMIYEVIRRCSLLEVLEVPGVGCQGILYTTQHLSRLRSVTFDYVRASEADIVSLLHSEEVRWPSCVREGKISSDVEFEFEYKPNAIGWYKVSAFKGW